MVRDDKDGSGWTDSQFQDAADANAVRCNADADARADGDDEWIPIHGENAHNDDDDDEQDESGAENALP